MLADTRTFPLPVAAAMYEADGADRDYQTAGYVPGPLRDYRDAAEAVMHRGFAEMQRQAAVTAFAAVARRTRDALRDPWTVEPTGTGARFTYERGITVDAVVTVGPDGETVVELDVALNGSTGQDPVTVTLRPNADDSTRAFRLMLEVTELRVTAEEWENVARTGRA